MSVQHLIRFCIIYCDFSNDVTPRRWTPRVPLEACPAFKQLTVGKGSGCWGVITQLLGEVVVSLVKVTLAQSKWITDWLMKGSSKHKWCRLYFSTDDEEHNFRKKIAHWKNRVHSETGVIPLSGGVVPPQSFLLIVAPVLTL